MEIPTGFDKLTLDLSKREAFVFDKNGTHAIQFTYDRNRLVSKRTLAVGSSIPCPR